ncbi:hypothetical protein B296_00003363, partial [Ensete ventricosum]
LFHFAYGRAVLLPLFRRQPRIAGRCTSIIRCVEPSPSVSESLVLILDGVQNLVALIGSVGRKMLAVADFYWLA